MPAAVAATSIWEISVETIFTSAVVACVTAFFTFLIAERRLRAELRTELMTERAVLELLKVKGWEKRSIGAIEKRIGGFQQDELRRALVRAGAVRFEGEKQEDGTRVELWGLVSRNKDDL